MPTETKELHDLRQGLYAAAAVGVERVDKPVPDAVEDGRMGVCRCCGSTAFIPVIMHVCRKCFEAFND